MRAKKKEVAQKVYRSFFSSNVRGGRAAWGAYCQLTVGAAFTTTVTVVAPQGYSQ
jgi:hypothetical protein